MKNAFLAHFYATIYFPFDFNPISGNFLAKGKHLTFELPRAMSKARIGVNFCHIRLKSKGNNCCFISTGLFASLGKQNLGTFLK